MELQRVNLVYFSPTSTTQKVAQAIARGVGNKKVVTYNFTRLQHAPEIPAFGPDELVVVGAPVYVGRIPHVALPHLQALVGNNTPCVLLGVYGNRHYDDYLVELEDLMTGRGFVPVAAAAFIGEHSFSHKIATDRPNAGDLAQAEAFGRAVAQKLAGFDTQPEPLAAGAVPGNRPYRQAYRSGTPRPAVAPVVTDACMGCGCCVNVCPTGAISDIGVIDASLCIKCRTCARMCLSSAIDFVDETFWEHTRYLEEHFPEQDKPVLTVV